MDPSARQLKTVEAAPTAMMTSGKDADEASVLVAPERCDELAVQK